jgi:hypothetical protein
MSNVLTRGQTELRQSVTHLEDAMSEKSLRDSDLRDAERNTRKILQRICLPVCERLEKMINRPIFIFLSPSFVEPELQTVRYYGLKELRYIDGLDGMRERLVNLFRKGDQDKKGLDRLVDFMRLLKKEFGTGKKSAPYLLNTAIELLSNAQVPLGNWLPLDAEIAGPSPPSHSEKKVLLDFAWELANLKEYPDKSAVKCYLNAAQDYGKFTSNACDEDEDIDCTLFIAHKYLTRDPYIYELDHSIGSRDDRTGTLLPFVAECLYFTEGRIIRPDYKLDLTKRDDLAKLVQIHLPIAALGQFRGSVCWISSDGTRESEDKKRLSIYLNQTTQNLLSEFLSEAILNVFGAKLEEALTYRDTNRGNRLGYFQRMALAFGDLFWCYRIDFSLGGRMVAHGKLSGEVTIDPADLSKVNSKPSEKERSGPHNVRSIDQEVSRLDIRLSDPINHSNVITIDLNRLPGVVPRQYIIDELGFDHIDLCTHLVRDRVRFHWAGPFIMGKISQVIREHRDTALLSLQNNAFVFGHNQKNELTERNAGALANRLQDSATALASRIKSLRDEVTKAVSKLRSGAQPDAELARKLEQQLKEVDQAVLVDPGILEDTLICLRSDQQLYGIAELFSVIAKVGTGKLPRRWLDPKFARSDPPPSAPLADWADVFRSHILRLTPYYAKNIKDRNLGFTLEIFESQESDLAPCSGVPNPPRCVLPFQDDTAIQDAARLTLLAGLTELTRNALKYMYNRANTKQLWIEHNCLRFIFKIVISYDKGTVSAIIWNPIMAENLRTGDSLLAIRRLSEQLRAVTIITPKPTSEVPGGCLPGRNCSVSEFSLCPSKIEFEESEP